MSELLIVYRGKPYTINLERRDTPYVRARKVREIRQDSFLLWKSKMEQWDPPPAPVEVEVQPHKIGRQLDLDAILPTAKAMLDGYVDAGGIPDDGPKYVESITFRRCLRVNDIRQQGVMMAIRSAPQPEEREWNGNRSR